MLINYYRLVAVFLLILLIDFYPEKMIAQVTDLV